MSELFDLTGRTALVTGSTRGIGKAIAVALAEHGARVVVSSRKADACEAVAGELRARGHQSIGVPCHVGRKEALQALVERTGEAFGDVDVLVCNAAINPHYGSALEVPDEVFAKVMATNVQSRLWLVQLTAPAMRARRDGAIVMVSSIGGLRGTPVIGSYAVSKAADQQLVRNLAVELGPDNVRVNAVAPGLVKTDFARALWEDPDYARTREAATPLRRFGEPRDVAGAVVFLASGAAAWITGQTLVVDGGVTIAG